MPTFSVTLKGPGHEMVRRINSPNRELVHSVLGCWGMLRWCVDNEVPCAAVPDNQADLVLDGDGKIIKGSPHWSQLWKGIVLRHRLKAGGVTKLLLAAVVDLIETIDSTGGVFRDKKGYLCPVVDAEWIDLAGVYRDCCTAAGIAMKEGVNEDDNDNDGFSTV
jgi:hypothetical protein